MKKIKTFILFLALSIYLFSSALPVPSLAAVNINSYCYNPRSLFAEDITVVNAQYADYTILLPGEIVSQGGGAKLGDIDSAFSHKIVYAKAYLGNRATISDIGASLETDSALYGWIKNLDEKREEPLLIAVSYALSDGNLTNLFWSNQAEIAEDLTIVGGGYSGLALVESDSVFNGGGGGIGGSNFSHVVELTSVGRATSKLEGGGNIQWQQAVIAMTEPKRGIYP